MNVKVFVKTYKFILLNMFQLASFVESKLKPMIIMCGGTDKQVNIRINVNERDNVICFQNSSDIFIGLRHVCKTGGHIASSM